MNEILLERSELVLLCWLNRSPGLPGMGEKPLGDLSPEMTRKVLAAAEEELTARGWLSAASCGGSEIKSEILRLIDIAIHPDQVVRFAKRLPSDLGEVAHFHLRGGLAVEHSSPQPGQDLLKFYPDPQLMLDALLARIGSIHTNASVKKQFQIAESVFFQADQIARKFSLKELEEKLIFWGIPKQQSQVLASVFVGRDSEISIAAFLPGSGSLSMDLLFWESGYTLWLIERANLESGIRDVIIRPITPTLLMDEIGSKLLKK